MAPADAAPTIGMVAGETSGDLLASLLLGGMQSRWPKLVAQGIGGPRMIARGFETWWPQDKLAVRGYVEVMRHYREIAGIRKQLARRLLDRPPQLFIGVDAPDFNLGLEATLRAAGVRTVHFICPSIWAWRGGRIKAIRQSVDHMLCIFPFEPELLQRQSVQATYVGHPLADTIPLVPPSQSTTRQQLGLPLDAPVVALLPGSRASEIESLAATFLQAARVMHAARRELHFVLPVAPGRDAQVQAVIAHHGMGLPITVLQGQSHEALAACDVTLIASGTATLEAALFKKPMVIAYRMNAISYHMMKRMGYQPWIGLPNILAQDFVVPERVQHTATPVQLAADTLAWFDAPHKAKALTQRFTDMHHTLKRDTARTATDAIEKILHS
jgi:lipid-A-disaccharide synthase